MAKEEKDQVAKAEARAIIKEFYHAISEAQFDKSFDIAVYKKSKAFERAKKCAIIAVSRIIKPIEDVCAEFNIKHDNFYEIVLNHLKATT